MTGGRLLATRTRKARHERACARCGLFTRRGERIGYVDQLGWCHVVPCIAGPIRQGSTEETPWPSGTPASPAPTR